MIAKGWDGRPVALVVCDSIGERQNDHILAADRRGNMGWLRRWLDTPDPVQGRIPHFLIGIPGASSDRELAAGATMRWDVLDQIIAFNSGRRPFTCLLDQLGQNNTGSTAAALTAQSEGLIDRITARYPACR